jgi:hypothetical protein
LLQREVPSPDQEDCGMSPRYITLIGACALVTMSSLLRAQSTAPTTRPAGRPDPFTQLLDGIKSTPGCHGVVTAPQTSHGQAVIFAFFQDKQAAAKWYYSPMHQELMKMIGAPHEAGHEPMKDVPDGVPVMALASITMGGKPPVEGSPIAFTQISIELYTPLSGGLNFGGGFSPEAFRALRKVGPGTEATTKPAAGDSR